MIFIVYLCRPIFLIIYKPTTCSQNLNIMATKIRLQRHGRKRRAFYHLVVTDSRVKRDGKCVENLGLINPNINPRSVEINFDRAVHWVKSGAEMSDTARSILSDLGVLLRKHLDGGVAKGALTQEEADNKFEAWKKDKSGKLDADAKATSDAETAKRNAQLDAEKKVKETRAAEIAKKQQEVEAANQPVVEVVETPAEETTEEVVAETSTEEAKEEKAE